jgi:hypothetical protein
MSGLIERKIVGSKGEILPSKKLREAVGLTPRCLVEIRVQRGVLVVKPIPDPVASLEGVLSVDLSIKELKRLAERWIIEATKKAK